MEKKRGRAGLKPGRMSHCSGWYLTQQAWLSGMGLGGKESQEVNPEGVGERERPETDPEERKATQ